MARALVYLPEPASRALAARRVAGRSLTLRVVAAAARAGASAIGVPAILREADLEQALRRVEGLAGRVRWLGEAGGAEHLGFTKEPCLLLPAAAVLDPGALRALLGRPCGPAGAALAVSAKGRAPVLLAPPALLGRLDDRLSGGHPVGDELHRHVTEARPELHEAPGAFVSVTDEAGLALAEAHLYDALGTQDDSSIDRLLHRRWSRWLTRLLVATPVTPNQISLVSLAIGLSAVWCFWRASPGSALSGVALYALASTVDHSDGEVARLTFQESRFGAHLDWLIDTVIHALVVFAMAVTAGGAFVTVMGLLAALGVTLSALCARYLPKEIEVGHTTGGLLRTMGNRDLFYVLLLAFVGLRWLAPAALPALVALVTLGSQTYWIACVTRIRRPSTGTRS